MALAIEYFAKIHGYRGILHVVQRLLSAYAAWTGRKGTLDRKEEKVNGQADELAFRLSAWTC